MNRERWRALSPWLERALELEGEGRAAWLAALRAEDASLAAELEQLLEEAGSLTRDGFLDGAGALRRWPDSLGGQAIGPWTLDSPIGHGGMGSVWLARRTDGRFEGRAAIKLLNAELLGGAGEERFRREGNILARLTHPNIARLLDAGISPSGQPYLVLEHVEGQHIHRWCDENGLDVGARLRLFLEVLAAVAHAHANLIVHRDLKPSNVLVSTGGQVKLLDFGIAKLLESDADGGAETALTREAGRALTPEYAAPEQVTPGPITTATDVYSLGVLLYLLLSGRHPAGAALRSPAALLRAVVDSEPQRLSTAVVDGKTQPPETLAEIAGCRASTPRKLRGVLRGDLDNIVAKALKKLPAERYASAEAMAEDLRSYLGHRPVRARADSFGYRVRKFVARNRLATAAAAVAALALVTGTGVALWQARIAADQRDRALLQLRRAETTIDFTGFLLSEATPTAGRPITNAELLARGEAAIDRRYARDPAMRVLMLLSLAERYQENQQDERWQAAVDRAFSLSREIRDPGLRSRAACAKARSMVDREGDEASRSADRLLAEAFRDLAVAPDSAADEAYCRVAEADIANAVGDEARAVPAAERAVALEEGRGAAVGRRFEAGLTLANAYLVAGRSVSADRAYRRLLALLESQGLEQSRDAAIVLNNWSAMWQNMGQHLRAVPLSERAVEVARARDTERGAVAALLRAHAMALCAVGRCAEAVPLLEEAVLKARAEGSSARLVGALTVSAAVYRETGELGRAADALREAATRLGEDPRATPSQWALIDRLQARVSLARGDPGAAVTHARRGAAREPDADRGHYEMVKVYLPLAEACNEHGDYVAAREAAARALRGATAILGELTRSLHVGQARLELGIALAGGGDLEGGRNELREAVDHLLASVGPEAPPTRRAQAHLELLGPGSPATR